MVAQGLAPAARGIGFLVCSLLGVTLVFDCVPGLAPAARGTSFFMFSLLWL